MAKTNDTGTANQKPHLTLAGPGKHDDAEELAALFEEATGRKPTAAEIEESRQILEAD